MPLPDGKSRATQFVPPYLRRDIPAEKEQIDAIIRATLPKSLRIIIAEEANLSTLTAARGFNPARGHAALPAGAAAKSRPTATPAGAETPSISAGIQAYMVDVVPGGNVPLGWYCDKEFRATLFNGQEQWCSWYLESGGVSHYLGTNYGGEVYFLLNGQSYYLYPPLFSVNLIPIGSKFRVRCEFSSTPLLTEYSDEVMLDYSNTTNNAPCVSMVEASLVDEDSPCQVVGTNHDRRPKVRVVLDKPAGPGGQLVTLLMDDPHSPAVGRWVANSHFTIPYQQKSAEYDGFLGTRKVTSKKTMSIRARVNGQESAPLTIEVKKN